MAISLFAFLVGAGMLGGAIWCLFAAWEASSSRRLDALNQVWNAYASAKGLCFTPFSVLSGVPGELGPPLVHGEVEGIPIELTLHMGPRPLTRLEGVLGGVPPGLVLSIRRRGWSRDIAQRHGHGGGPLEDTRTGNQAFEAQFLLRSTDPDRARALLDHRLTNVVLGFPRPLVELSARRNRMRLAWQGAEMDPKVLDAALTVVFTACRRRA